MIFFVHHAGVYSPHCNGCPLVSSNRAERHTVLLILGWSHPKIGQALSQQQWYLHLNGKVSCTKHLFEHEFRKGRPPTQQHKGQSFNKRSQESWWKWCKKKVCWLSSGLLPDTLSVSPTSPSSTVSFLRRLPKLRAAWTLWLSTVLMTMATTSISVIDSCWSSRVMPFIAGVVLGTFCRLLARLSMYVRKCWLHYIKN